MAHTKTIRSFQQPDGERRRRDLRNLTEPVIVGGRREAQNLSRSRPASNPRIIKKIVRGLSHYLAIEQNIQEGRIFADVLPFLFPEEYRDSWKFYQCVPDIFKCWYQVFDEDEDEISAVWILTFYERRYFIARVSAPGVVFEAPD